MQLIDDDGEKLTVRLDRSEVVALNNALSWILNGSDAIEEDDFDTLIGVSLDEAEALLRAIHELPTD